MKKRFLSIFLTIMMLLGTATVFAAEVYIDAVESSYSPSDVNVKNLFITGTGSVTETGDDSSEYTVLADGTGSKLKNDKDGGTHSVDADKITVDVKGYQLPGVDIYNDAFSELSQTNYMNKYICFDAKIDGRVNYMRVIFSTGDGNEVGSWKLNITEYEQGSDGYYKVALPLSTMSTNYPERWDNIKFVRMQCWGSSAVTTDCTMYLKNIALKDAAEGKVPEKQLVTEKDIYTDGNQNGFTAKDKSNAEIAAEADGSVKIVPTSEANFISFNKASGFANILIKRKSGFYVQADIKTENVNNVRIGFVSSANGEQLTPAINLEKRGTLQSDGFYRIKIPMTEFNHALGSVWGTHYGLRVYALGLGESPVMYVNDVKLVNEEYAVNAETVWNPYGLDITSGCFIAGANLGSGTQGKESDGSYKVTTVQAASGVLFAKDKVNNAYVSLGITEDMWNDTYLRFDVKSVAANNLNVFITTNPGDPNDTGRKVTVATTTQWQTVRIPLSQYTFLADVAGIRTKLENIGTYYLRNIAFEYGPERIFSAEMSLLDENQKWDVTGVTAGKTINAVVDYKNGFKNKSCKLCMVFAIYNGDTLVKADVQECTADVYGGSGTSEGQLISTYTVPDDASGYKLKVMLWNDAGKCVPLTDLIEIK
ncbi:MAG: hypothetical protein ACI4DY_01035 [Monoglobaceae bacterium]